MADDIAVSLLYDVGHGFIIKCCRFQEIPAKKAFHTLYQYFRRSIHGKIRVIHFKIMDRADNIVVAVPIGFGIEILFQTQFYLNLPGIFILQKIDLFLVSRLCSLRHAARRVKGHR